MLLIVRCVGAGVPGRVPPSAPPPHASTGTARTEGGTARTDGGMTGTDREVLSPAETTKGAPISSTGAPFISFDYLSAVPPESP